MGRGPDHALAPRSGVRGARSLNYMHAFAAAPHDGTFVQGGLAQISWCHHLTLLEKLDDPELRVWYALRDHSAPIQISEYRTGPLPAPYQDALPSTERIAARLRELPMPAPDQPD